MRLRGGINVKGLDGLAVNAEFHFGKILAGLLGIGFGAQNVIAVLGHVERGRHFAVVLQDALAALVEFAVADHFEALGRIACAQVGQRAFEFHPLDHDGAGLPEAEAPVLHLEFIGAAAQMVVTIARRCLPGGMLMRAS